MEMPDLDGLGTLRELRRTHPRLPVIMFSTLTERGAGATLDALALGANDYVCKPANVGGVPEAIASVRDQLVPKIKALCPQLLGAPPAVRRRRRRAGAVRRAPGRSHRRPAIGSSTGGPGRAHVGAHAAAGVVPGARSSSSSTCRRSSPGCSPSASTGKCALSVKEAEHGDVVVPGRVLIAPGDKHLELTRVGTSVVAQLTSAPPEHFCRPAVDVLFRSVAQVYGGSTLAVVLTGHGLGRCTRRRGPARCRRRGRRAGRGVVRRLGDAGRGGRRRPRAPRPAPRPHRRRRGRRRRPVPSVGARGSAAMSLAASDFDYIRDVVRRHSAIVLDPGKEYLVESRLVPLARKEGEQSIASLVARMRTERTGTLTGRVVDAMTTNETSFFRDDHPFDAMQKHVLPELVLARAAERRLAVWCGASSSGQEPYTLTMLLEDVLATRPGWQASLLATDISRRCSIGPAPASTPSSRSTAACRSPCSCGTSTRSARSGRSSPSCGRW
jgi:hypothetical protein